MTNSVITKLSAVLADSYVLYLKTQGYHWNVKGPQFHTLHEMFEQQYQALAEAIDKIAERIMALGGSAPATFSAYQSVTTLAEADITQSAHSMVEDLAEDQQKLIVTLKSALKAAEAGGDEVSVDLLIERIEYHQKIHWMLKATLAS